MLVDITERKKAEISLRESEQKYKYLIKNARSAIVKLNKNGFITFFNEYASELFGYSEQEVLGKHVIGVIVPGFDSDKQDLKKMVEMFVSSTGEHYDKTNENENITKSGKLIWMSWANKAVVDNDGNILEIISTGIDISERKIAENALKKTEEQQTRILDTFKDGIHITTPKYIIEYANSSLQKKIGRNPVGENCHKAIYNLNKKCDWCIYDKLTKEKSSYNYELEIEDGKIIDVSNILLENKNKLTIYNDITDRKNAEKQVKESEYRFRKMIEQLPLPMVIIDEKQDIEYFNDKFIEQFGYTLNDISTIEKWRATVYPDEKMRNEVKNSWDLAISEAVANNTNIKMQEWEITIKDGTNRLCEFYMMPFSGFSLIVMNDITERKIVEDALRASENRLRTLINSVPDIICFKDGEGRWLIANDADLKLFNMVDVDYQGKKDSELAKFSPFYFDAFMGCEETDEIAWNNDGSSRGIEIIPNPNGEDFTYDIIKVPIFNSDNTRNALVVFGRDISEMKKNEEALKIAKEEADIANRLKSEFLANM
ncbi:MAG: PAS domain S-box protein, partial [Bacteroidales bacterium]|nr:PAS domain S-box protein [Bacteroidales bacterium]